MTDPHTDKKAVAGRLALGLTIFCMLAGTALLALIVSVKGPEALGIILPMILVMGLHIVFIPMATFLAFSNRFHLLGTVILAYTGLALVGLAAFLGLGPGLTEALDRHVRPKEVALYRLLLPIAVLNRQMENHKETEIFRQAEDLLANGADPLYILPGHQRSIAVLAAAAGNGPLMALILEKAPYISVDLGIAHTIMAEAIEYGRADVIKTLLATSIRFPLYEFEHRLAHSRALKDHPAGQKAVIRLFENRQK